MKLENQVITLEQAKRLKELGVVQESIFFWVHSALWHHKAVWENWISQDYATSAFTVAELGVMLPAFYTTHNDELPNGERCFTAIEWDGSDVDFIKGLEPAKIEAEARGAMLIHLLENNLITAQEVNHRLQNS